VDKFCNTLFLLTRIDEEYRSARVDPLTELPNRRAVDDLLPPMVARANADAPVAALILEADHLEDMSEKYGHVVMDQVVQELAELIQTSARVEELNAARPSDKYIRYDTSQFLLLSEDIDGTQALAVAERIREAIDAKIDWPGGVPSVSLSVGIALLPVDAEDGHDLLRKAEVALMYLKEHDERNSAIRFDQVPRHFRMEKLSGGVSGSLQVFDPATTLQSVARAQRTGILTVTNEGGVLFWSFFEHGKLKKAYLEQFRADVAVVEFLSTFSDGDFDFREYDLLDAETLEHLHLLDDSYNCVKTLDRNLMDGALAQDQLAEARRVIPNTRLFVKPTARYREILASLPALKDAPSAKELEAMQAICKHVNGRTMLSAIIDRMDAFPTHLRWHGAALLVRYEAVELTRLALSFTL
jgi:diguanylate cyclase (GGDEF)-like protein